MVRRLNFFVRLMTAAVKTLACDRANVWVKIPPKKKNICTCTVRDRNFEEEYPTHPSFCTSASANPGRCDLQSQPMVLR